MFDHFLRAQEPVYPQVLAELRIGRKRSHWMWFIFPQLAGLGMSATAAHFAIANLDQARTYAAHDLLGVRLRECVNVTNGLKGDNAFAIFGYPDDMKFRSCLTLFLQATGDPLFRAGIDKYFHGAPDALTMELLSGAERK